MAHLELSIPWRGSTEQPRRPTYLKFENRSRAFAAPDASNHWLYPIELSRSSSSYPEGNFGGNQLLDGSISLSPLYPSQTNDFARQYRCGPPPEFPLASPRSGIVHHLSGPDRRSRSVGVAPLGGDRAGQLPYALRVCSPVDSHTCQTPWSVFQDGSNGEPAGQRRERAVAEARRGRALSATIGATAFRGHIDCPGFGRRLNPRWSAPRADRRTGSRRSTSRPGRIAGPHPLPSRQFQALFDSLFKVLFIFPSRYLFAIGLSPVFSLGRNLPPDWGCIPKQPDSPTAPRGAAGSGHDGALTLSGAPFQGTWARSAAEDASPDYNSDSEAARFSSWAVPGSLAVTRGILRVIPPDLGSRSEALAPLASPRDRIWAGRARGAHGRPMSAPHATGGGATRCVTPRQTCPGLMASGATCVQRLDGSRDSAIHTKYRISLRSSSMREPRYPLPRVVLTFERRPLRPCTPRTGPPCGGRFVRFSLARCRAGGSLARTSSAFARAGGGGDRTGAFAPRPGPDFVCNVFAVCFCRFRQ
ncbi:UNVERIFIED_CONTAM: putative uncharacterized protein ART3 [Sesamum indicum]